VRPFVQPYITLGSRVSGLIPGEVVTVSLVEWDDEVCELTYRRRKGHQQTRIMYPGDWEFVEVLNGENVQAPGFSADGNLFKVAAEARRIQLASLYDPFMAIHSSKVEPMPHQIEAVYECLLPKYDLRYVLADDPGAGKTIMSGLYIRELQIRGLLKHCLIVAPGSLVANWQEELHDKFSLETEIISRAHVDSAPDGDPFSRHEICIARLDMLKLDDELIQAACSHTWDLIIVDEAHKMSVSVFGNEAKESKRFKLGMKLEKAAVNFLLLTATPHNGKDEEFQQWLRLLDRDRFEKAASGSKKREVGGRPEISDLMRRKVKEKLSTFDGKPLFPPREAHTLTFTLTPAERDLYESVTEYVSTQFNKASQLTGQKRAIVGFVLTLLQRRLASSPLAILRSLENRHRKLSDTLDAVKEAIEFGKFSDIAPAVPTTLEGMFDDEEWDEDAIGFDEEDDAAIDDLISSLLPGDLVLTSDNAGTIVFGLKQEIFDLKELVNKAKKVLNLGTDTKWSELSTLLTSDMMARKDGHRRKIIIFTEHRATIEYLTHKIAGVIGDDPDNMEKIAVIHGGVRRKDRLTIQHRFNHDPTLEVLVANDAAGEGINLHRAANYMVNYDLPWNPNRLEQRFGRIHRIGQKEICHLWNLMAKDTREEMVFGRLLEKIANEKEQLDGEVFDILGVLIPESDLKRMLMDAVRRGASPEAKKHFEKEIASRFDLDKIREIRKANQLTQDEEMGLDRIEEIRLQMERAKVRRLQPHYLASFFREAIEILGGQIIERKSEIGRFEVRRVPKILQEESRRRGRRIGLSPRYERVTFDKHALSIEENSIEAELIGPGHALLDVTTNTFLEKHGWTTLGEGAILVDPEADEPRLLCSAEHSVRDHIELPDGSNRVASHRQLHVELLPDGTIHDAGAAPYLDLVAWDSGSLDGHDWSTEDRVSILKKTDLNEWGNTTNITKWVNKGLARIHYEEIRAKRIERCERVAEQVNSRLITEIDYWDAKARVARDKHSAGKKYNITEDRARTRAENLGTRRSLRLEYIEKEKNLYSDPPIIVSRALVVPLSWLIDEKESAGGKNDRKMDTEAKNASEAAGMAAVVAIELQAGRTPSDRSAERGIGYDIESIDRSSEVAQAWFIEVKSRHPSADNITLTRNEALAALNHPERFILAIAEVEGGVAGKVGYVRDLASSGVLDGFKSGSLLATSLNLPLKDLWSRVADEDLHEVTA
jgi:superfamily II DNA or RNA helicase